MDSGHSTKILFVFPVIFCILHLCIVGTICFNHKCVSTVSCMCIWSLNVDWQECHALCCRRWAYWDHQVPVAFVWRATDGMLPHWTSTDGSTGQGQGVWGSRELSWFQSARSKCHAHVCTCVSLGGILWKNRCRMAVLNEMNCVYLSMHHTIHAFTTFPCILWVNCRWALEDSRSYYWCDVTFMVQCIETMPSLPPHVCYMTRKTYLISHLLHGWSASSCASIRINPHGQLAEFYGCNTQSQYYPHMWNVDYTNVVIGKLYSYNIYVPCDCLYKHAQRSNSTRPRRERLSRLSNQSINLHEHVPKRGGYSYTIHSTDPQVAVTNCYTHIVYILYKLIKMKRYKPQIHLSIFSWASLWVFFLQLVYSLLCLLGYLHCLSSSCHISSSPLLPLLPASISLL